MKNKILAVVAHPDDEVIGCGGSLLKHQYNGDEINIMYMTDGESSRTSNSKVFHRHKNAIDVCNFLNVKKKRFLNLPDNALDTFPLLSIIKIIKKEIDNIKPNIIYTHFSGDLNIDHSIISNAVMVACRPEPSNKVEKIYAFEVLSSTEWNFHKNQTFAPTYFNDISKFIKKKIKLLEIYKNEIRKVPHTRSIENIINLSQIRGKTIGLKYCEAFKLVYTINNL